jgi:hypothetical protein
LAYMLVGLKSLVISLDYRSYMGSSARIWSFRWLFLYLCSYNLDGYVTVLVLMQDRCTGCAEQTTGSEIILHTLDGTRWWCGSYGILLWSIWRQCWCRCKIGARFALDVPHAHKSFWTDSIELYGDVGHVESHFGRFRDNVRVSAR